MSSDIQNKLGDEIHATKFALSAEQLTATITRVRASRDRGVRWLLDHIDADGKAIGADTCNSWSRLSWVFAIAGEGEAAARVIAWAERGQFADDGGFAAGPALGTGRFGAYPLAHVVLGAWLAERFDTALAAMDALRRMQDPATGGFPIVPVADRATDIYDLMSTSMAGLAAVISGQDDVADLAWRWVRDLVALQPADAGLRLYTFRRGAALLTEPEKPLAWLAVPDFAKPRQPYYYPGIAAVFLAAYAQRRRVTEPLEIAAKLLRFNIDGCAEQFDDAESVQVCKFGWGAAAMLVADPAGDWLRHVVRMGDWFITHQEESGAWVPSAFFTPEPSDVDRMIKTAEHVMEVNAILAALGTARGRLK